MHPIPVYRIAVIVVGILVAVFLYLLFTRTRLGMQIRAGASNREMAGALGVNIRLLYTLVFGLGTLLAGLAGVMAGPILAVEAGMGESILILTFVVIVIGGIGSIRGALVGALLVGMVDTLGRAFLPALLRLFLPAAYADGVGASLASMSIYILMAAVLVWRPRGCSRPMHKLPGKPQRPLSVATRRCILLRGAARRCRAWPVSPTWFPFSAGS